MPKNKIVVVDPELCNGCHSCEMACSLKHFDKCGSNYSRIRIQEFRDVNTFIPMVCQKCEDASCINHCPVNARIRLENGAVVTDEDRCIGCKACLYSCKFGAIHINPDSGLPMSCNLCADDPNGPWCVRACTMQKALQFLDVNDCGVDRGRQWAHSVKNEYAPKSAIEKDAFQHIGYGMGDEKSGTEAE